MVGRAFVADEEAERRVAVGDMGAVVEAEVASGAEDADKALTVAAEGTAGG